MQRGKRVVGGGTHSVILTEVRSWVRIPLLLQGAVQSTARLEDALHG